MKAPPFYVILGGDCAGKSSVLEQLAAGRENITGISHEAVMRYDVTGSLAQLFTAFRQNAGQFKQMASPDFILSCFQTYLVALRDRIAADDSGFPILVDSYYYKILCKCQLQALVNENLFRFWRSFPQPRGVFFLDTGYDIAWQRALQQKKRNSFESYSGTQHNKTAFTRFQHDLKNSMLAEIGQLPCYMLNGNESVAMVAEKIILHLEKENRYV